MVTMVTHALSCTVCTGMLQDVVKSTAMVQKMEKSTNSAIEELE